MKRSTELLSQLAEKGYKKTKNREAILDIIYSYDKPISAGDLLEKLDKKGLQPNKTTVYRKLEILMKEGLIREIMIDSTTAFYERSDIHHHHHLICLNCKKVTDFHPGPEMEEALNKTEKTVSKKYSFQPLQHSFEFFGYCSDCSQH